MNQCRHFGRYETLQAVLNWFAVALMLMAWIILPVADRPVTPPISMLLTMVPLVVLLLARRPRSSGAARLVALTTNWLAAVLAGGLAGAAFTGIGGTYALFPLLASAAALYYWNAAAMFLA